MQVAVPNGKNQIYEIRIGEYPGQVSNYFDKFADAQMTEHCYYDQSTRAIVRDLKDNNHCTKDNNHCTQRIYSKSYDQMMIEYTHNGTGKKFTAHLKRTG